MKLHIIRHAQAEDRSAATPDQYRSLTGRGRRRFRRVATALGKLGIDPGLIFTSPKVRAVQTAEILAERLDFCGEVRISPLLGEDFTVAALRRFLLTLSVPGEVVMVGHEPDLGLLVTELLATSAPCRLTRGSVVTIKLTDTQERLTAKLLRVVTGGGKVLTQERQALERLNDPPLSRRNDEEHTSNEGVAADPGNRRDSCAKADRCRKRQLCQGCRPRGRRAEGV